MTYSLQQARANLVCAVGLVGDLYGVKARDPNEPGKDRKEKYERKLYLATMRQFRRQTKKLRRALDIYYPERKAAFGVGIPSYEWGDIYDDSEYQDDVRRILTDSAQDGVLLFEEMASLSMDYTLVNSEAIAWANAYSGTLVSGISATTISIIKKAIADFIAISGMTIADVMRSLTQIGFSPSRALRIAVTEITRAYGSAEEIAGKRLQKEFPDVQVVKTWFTNNDDRVCDICGPLHDMTVKIDEGFTTEKDKSLGIPSPPAHVNCRCWMSTTTRIT